MNRGEFQEKLSLEKFLLRKIAFLVSVPWNGYRDVLQEKLVKMGTP